MNRVSGAFSPLLLQAVGVAVTGLMVVMVYDVMIADRNCT